MKTITIKQPWASLIIEPDLDNPGFGIKPIENRTWPTKFRGRVLVHAAAKPWIWQKVLNYLTEPLKSLFAQYGFKGSWLRNLPVGAIIGSVEIVDCVTNHSSIWAERAKGDPSYEYIHGEKEVIKPIYNWVLANPIKFPEPIPCKGKLSFWDYPNILAGPEEKDGELFCHCQLSVKEEIQVSGDSRFGYYCIYCGGRWYH